MTSWLIFFFAFISFPALAEENFWTDNKLTPAQPFPGRVLAVESGWGGYRLFIQSIGEADKKYCVAKVWPAGGGSPLEYREIQASDLPEPSQKAVFLNPPIEVNQFSWSMGVWRIGKIFEGEDALRKAVALKGGGAATDALSFPK
jgi:hypothetical protein